MPLFFADYLPVKAPVMAPDMAPVAAPLMAAESEISVNGNDLFSCLLFFRLRALTQRDNLSTLDIGLLCGATCMFLREPWYGLLRLPVFFFCWKLLLMFTAGFRWSKEPVKAFFLLSAPKVLV